MNDTLNKYTVSFGISLVITVLFSALLVVVKELSDHTILPLMKQATGHHWVTHTVLDVILFVVLGFLLTIANVKISPQRLTRVIVAATVIGALVVAGFYLIAG